jgi:hypothetical protein
VHAVPAAACVLFLPIISKMDESIFSQKKKKKKEQPYLNYQEETTG